MVKTRNLNVRRSCARNGRRDNREESFPQVESSQEFDDDMDHIEHQDDDSLNMLGNIEKVYTRGRTALPDVYNIPDGARIVVSCNPHGQPIGEEGGVLGKFLGVIAKNGAYCPLDENDWRKVKKDGGDETILQCIQTQFVCPPLCHKWILKTVGRDWRRYKATLKKEIFKPNAKKKRKALYKLCPEDVEEDQWKTLVKFWKSKEGRDLSEKNKRSRSMVKTTHTAGTKSFARWAEEMRQMDPQKRQPHRASVYLATHRKRSTHKEPEPAQNEHVIELEDLINKQPELAHNDEGRIAWEGDALHKVLGDEKPGQVHGMGLLPVPKQVYGRIPRRFKNMNISTEDTSSYQGVADADAREENARLREQLEKQELVIEQLKNQQGSHENNETTREIHRETFSDDSQTRVAISLRKRVLCNTPDPLGPLTQERETLLNKNTFVENHDIHTDNDEENMTEKHLEHEDDNGLAYRHGQSSAPLSTNLQEKKNKRQKFADSTVRTRRSSTQGHIPSKRKHKSSMEDGTKIILKTHVYPNKRSVAYATFITNSPTRDVAGVELGSEFTHVSVEEAIDGKEKLVRERANCKTIGDACALGLTIAWPSACIEKMN